MPIRLSQLYTLDAMSTMRRGSLAQQILSTILSLCLGQGLVIGRDDEIRDSCPGSDGSTSDLLLQ